MINSLFLNKCYHGRYYVDWSVMNYKNLEHFKTKFKTWWERVTDNTHSTFMNANIQTKIIPVKGYNSYNVTRNTTNNNSKNKMDIDNDADDIVISDGINDNNNKKYIDLEVPQTRMKNILGNNGDMILRILDLKRNIKKVTRNKMPLGWKIVKQRRQYGISKGHEETIYVGPNDEKTNSTSGMLRIIKRNINNSNNNDEDDHISMNNGTSTTTTRTTTTTTTTKKKKKKKQINLSYFETDEMINSIKAEDEVAILMEKLENDLALLAKLSDSPMVLDLKSIEFQKLWGNIDDLPFTLRNKFGKHLLNDADYMKMKDKKKKVLRYTGRFLPTNGDYVSCGALKGHVLIDDEDEGDDSTTMMLDQDIVKIQLEFGICYAHITHLIVLEKVTPRPNEKVNVRFGTSIFRGQVLSYQRQYNRFAIRLYDLKLAHGAYTYIYCKKDHFVQENGGKKKELVSGNNRAIVTTGNKRKSIDLTDDNEYKKQRHDD